RPRRGRSARRPAVARPPCPAGAGRPGRPARRRTGPWWRRSDRAGLGGPGGTRLALPGTGPARRTPTRPPARPGWSRAGPARLGPAPLADQESPGPPPGLRVVGVEPDHLPVVIVGLVRPALDAQRGGQVVVGPGVVGVEAQRHLVGFDRLVHAPLLSQDVADI